MYRMFTRFGIPGTDRVLSDITDDVMTVQPVIG